jgi:hypothetical protein
MRWVSVGFVDRKYRNARVEFEAAPPLIFAHFIHSGATLKEQTVVYQLRVTLAIQGHDPESVIHYKNFIVKPLSD